MTETISSTGTPMQNMRLTARALLLGDRLDVAGLERSDVLSTTPLAFRAGQDGFGIQTAPAAARTVAALVRTGTVPPDIAAAGLSPAALSPTRFR